MRVPDAFDAYDEMEDGEPVNPGQHAPIARCKRCGSTDVRWRFQGGGWQLFSLTPGVVHECAPMAGADEFA